MLMEFAYVALLLVILIVLAEPTGRYIANIFSGDRTLLSPLLRPVEQGLYRICGVDDGGDVLEDLCDKPLDLQCAGIDGGLCAPGSSILLPFNPQALGPVRWDTALNTAVSFATNTNWQSYSGEQTMSYLTQMLGLTVQNFLSAAIGIAVAMAVIRGFIRKNTATIGNFWVDLTRSVLYLLLPLAVIWALIFRILWRGSDPGPLRHRTNP